jgi:hypothetical protein
MATSEARERVLSGGSAVSLVHSFASQDWLTIGYLTAILVALAFGKGPHRGESIVHVAEDAGVFLVVLVAVRTQLLRWGSIVTALAYRGVLMGTLLATFFQLREILPAVSPYYLDDKIYALDLRVFGFEPSLWFDQFVSPFTTEWFAFFYFLYFLILTVHVLPMMMQRDEVLLSRFGVGILMLFMVAHLVYMVVPGWGPYWYLKGEFHHELQGGLFWRLVRETVDAGGSQKDIFPSLHTAAPTFMAIYSIRHRKLLPFRYTWPIVTFLATQMILATMFLRWHYLADVVAGLVLATAVSILGQRIADWERVRRERLGVQPAWMPLVYPWSR